LQRCGSSIRERCVVDRRRLDHVSFGPVWRPQQHHRHLAGGELRVRVDCRCGRSVQRHAEHMGQWADRRGLVWDQGRFGHRGLRLDHYRDMPPKPPQRRLTEEQRKLAERHVDHATSLAGRMCRWMDYDAKLSAAMWGLCEAAVDSEGVTDFKAWSGKIIANRILQLARGTQKAERWRTADDDWLSGIEAKPATHVSDARLDAAVFRGRFDRLSARERDILERRAAGDRWVDIARDYGTTKESIESSRRAARKKLKA
jgi:DNA-directed RNA polymerase specialized sigma24 family protein